MDMVRNLSVAAVQMDANPALTAERLARAELLVDDAAQNGAQLIVLPELFNTGYAYADDNYARAERLDGPTVTWMRDLASRLDVHLAGTLMVLERGDIYNALLLFAPDGHMWRYDKNYPWGWERGYFREPRDGRHVVIADTDLGDFGFLICWDVAHRKLWAQYAGLVDMMVICSCPPDVSDPTYLFPNGDEVTADDMGYLSDLKGSGREIFGAMINQQTAWLGVPAVNTVGCGRIITDIPNGRRSLLSYALAAPWLLKYLSQADRLRMACDLTQGTKVVDANGFVLTELTQAAGETFALTTVDLPDQKPSPQDAQPASLAPLPVYFMSDVLLPAIVGPVYQRGLRQLQ
jgi:hypothetical protein